MKPTLPYLPTIKIFKALIFFFFLFFISAGNSFSQVPPPVVDCNQTDDPEFHSLRPYQASPCKSEVSETAEFCGDSLSITDNITVTYDPSDPSCHPIARGKVQCNYTIRKTKSVAIDLSEAELPIMGNTELVRNSQTNKEELDDAQKVNEYVSWYLNGVINRAEYGETDVNKVIDFSGPIKKLLPQTIQESERIKTIKSAKNDRHNQIVVCGESSFGIIGDIFNIGSIAPKECYKGDGSKAEGLGKEVFRLVKGGGADGWNGDLSFWNRFIDDIVGRLVSLLPNIPESIIRNSVLKHWNKRIPPLPWENDPFAKPERQMTALEYRKYYNEWQGKTCVIVPLLNWLVCFDNILVPNKYADLFPYVPLSSTEDRKGEAFVDSGSITTSDPGIKIISVNFTSADLYFSHMEEAPQLADTLQNTFAYKDADKAGPATSVAPPDTGGRACQVVDVRSNEGDNLFAGEIGGSFTYEASFSCIFDPTRQTPKTCSKSATINFGIKTKTPKADEAWSRLVAGPAAVFKRIYPQMNENSPIQCLADIPAATKVNYSGDVNQPGELYFPHIGGISEYFLKGIQTALRPKGYGELITSGTDCKREVEVKCKQDVPDSAVPAKYLGSFKTNFIDLANRWSAKCPGPDNNMAEECYNYVASETNKAGVNPAFALTIWLNESGASNYCEGGSTTQDFGINLSSIYQNIVEQLKVFLNMAKTKLCDGVSGFTEPMHGWLSRFQSSAGACDPSDTTATQYYINVRDNTWTWVTGCAKGGKFGITWPTDSSCP